MECPVAEAVEAVECPVAEALECPIAASPEELFFQNENENEKRALEGTFVS